MTSSRQRRIANFNSPIEDRKESQKIAAHLVASHGSEFQELARGEFWRIAVRKPSRATSRNRLEASTAMRLDKLRRACAQIEKEHLAERKRVEREKLAERIKRLRASADPLDAQIELQLSTQSERHRSKLRRLYFAAVAHNELYFGGKLALPIIVAAKIRNAQANCCCGKHNDCVITFDLSTIETRSAGDLAEILLHEMVHQAIGHADKHDSKYGWHHSEFAQICNRIARERGWPDCTVEKKEGPKAASFWPPRTHY